MLRKISRMFQPKPRPIEIEEKGVGDVVVRFGAEEISVTLPYPDFSNPTPTPRTPITLVTPACPYCGVIQDPPPTRRRKCRDCKETIYTWTDQETRKKHLLTAKQHAQRQQEARDAEWADLNQRVIEGSRSEDWHTVKMAHFRQALMLFEQGRDHHYLASESRKSELRLIQTNHRNLGVQRVVIAQASDCCLQCSSLEGREYSIDEALEVMPIPVKTCLYWAEKNPHGGWCVCYYAPVIPHKEIDPSPF